MNHAEHHHSPTHDHGPTDPVCGMSVKSTSAHRTTHEGQEVLFCSAKCKDKFVADPAKYTRQEPVTAPAPAGSKYTCPMHPEIVRDGPGSCPICGMALEPMMPTLDAGPDPELREMTHRFWVATAFTLPLFSIVMGEMLGVELFAPRTRVWVELALATPVCTWAAWPF